MRTENVSGGAVVFASCYIKRWLQKQYDTLMALPVFEPLRNAHPNTVYVIEAMAYALTAYADQKIDETNPLVRMVKDIIGDAGPEIFSRLLRDVRSDLRTEEADPQSRYRAVCGKMLSLDDEALLTLLKWLETVDDETRSVWLKFAESATSDELRRFSRASAEQRSAMMGMKAKSGSSFWGEAKQFVKDFGAVLASGAGKGAAIGAEVLDRYMRGLFWLFRVCGILWSLGVTCWLFSNLIGGNAALSLVLLLLLCGCVGMVLYGQRHELSWLRVAGLVAAVSVAMQLLLAVAGEHRTARSIAFLTLIGIPVVGLVIAVFPVGAVVDLLKRLLPLAYATLSRFVKIALLAFIWAAFYSVGLMFLPTGSHPLAPFVLAPLSLAVLLAMGMRLIDVNPDRFLGWPLAVAVVFLHVVCFAAILMPDLMARIGRIPGEISDQFVEAPTPVTFRTSSEIDFVDAKGRTRIWYAGRADGGFDLFYSKSADRYTPDGRKLALADNETIRSKIRDWVDHDAARRLAEEQELKRRQAEEQAQKEADQAREAARRLAEEQELKRRQAEEQAQKEAEQARKAEEERRQAAELAAEEARRAELARIEAERARRSSYLLHLPTEKADCVVFYVNESGAASGELTSLIVRQYQARGVKAVDNVFSNAFIGKEGFDAFFGGHGGEDIKALSLSNSANCLILIKGSGEKVTASKTIAGLHTVAMKMNIAVIDTADGSKVRELEIADVTGAGVNEAAARSAFYERFADAVVAQAIQAQKPEP